MVIKDALKHAMCFASKWNKNQWNNNFFIVILIPEQMWSYFCSIDILIVEYDEILQLSYKEWGLTSKRKNYLGQRLISYGFNDTFSQPSDPLFLRVTVEVLSSVNIVVDDSLTIILILLGWWWHSRHIQNWPNIYTIYTNVYYLIL